MTGIFGFPFPWRPRKGWAPLVGYSAGVTGQEFSSKINDELTLFACNSWLQALQKRVPPPCAISKPCPLEN
jgi:hypothetical protein